MIFVEEKYETTAWFMMKIYHSLSLTRFFSRQKREKEESVTSCDEIATAAASYSIMSKAKSILQ